MVEWAWSKTKDWEGLSGRGGACWEGEGPETLHWFLAVLWMIPNWILDHCSIIC